jgi:hypothetical protein
MTSLAMMNLAVKRSQNRPPVRSPWVRQTYEPNLVVPPMLTSEERMAKLEADLNAFEQRMKS